MILSLPAKNELIFLFPNQSIIFCGYPKELSQTENFSFFFEYLNHTFRLTCMYNTLDKQQSKRLLTINERRSKMARNSVFDCHLLPLGNRWQSKTLFLMILFSKFLESIHFFDCRLSGVYKEIVVLHPQIFAALYLCRY